MEDNDKEELAHERDRELEEESYRDINWRYQHDISVAIDRIERKLEEMDEPCSYCDEPMSNPTDVEVGSRIWQVCQDCSPEVTERFHQ